MISPRESPSRRAAPGANRGRLRALLVFTMMASACESPSVMRPDAAYDPTALTQGTLYRWANGRTLQVFVAADPSSPYDLGLAVRQAQVRWNAVPQFAEFELRTTTDLTQADIVVYDRAVGAPVSPGSARAERLPLGSGGIGRATVVIRLDRGRVTTQSALNAVVAHEFGHALGIGAHSTVATDLMFGLPTVEAPSARDAATLRFVLGKTPQLSL
jgi:hypothetical protein